MRLFRIRGNLVERAILATMGEGMPAEAEVHRFEERLYVTTGWGTAWAVPVPPAADTDAVGALVQRALEESRRDPEPIFLNRTSDRREKRHEKAWERFCRDVAGTSVIRYRPEIRIGVLKAEGAVLVRPILPGARPDLEAQVQLSSDVSAEQLGEAVVRLLAGTPPYWPAARRATVATASGDRLVVHPHHGMYLSGPVRVLGAGVDERTLGREIAAALAVSSIESDEHEDYYAALEAVGVDERDLEGGADATIEETSRGTIRVSASKPVAGGSEQAGPEETIEDADMEAVARTALEQLRDIRTRHRRPGTETGVSWAYKTAWLAVRTEDSAAVVDALALTGRRELTWKTAVEKSYSDGIFVTPATSGWTFAVGMGWSDREPDLAALSADLGAETQFFATHRVVDLHTWSLARGGTLVRRVWYLGESGELEESGEPTEVEQDLGLEDLDVDSAIELIDEETVMQVAGAWSIDPRELGTTPTSAQKGVHGKLPRA